MSQHDGDGSADTNLDDAADTQHRLPYEEWDTPEESAELSRDEPESNRPDTPSADTPGKGRAGAPKEGPDDDRADVEQFAADGHWIDDRAGHGALSSTEDWVRNNDRPASNDGRSTTETTFYDDTYTKGPGQKHRPRHKRKSWQDLAIVNDGAYAIDESRGGQNFAADKKRWVQTFASKLQATPYQTEHAEYVIERMEMGPYQGARMSSEIVILGVLSLLIDADVEQMEDRAVERAAMGDLLADLECARPDLTQARRLIHRNDFELLFPNVDDD